MYACIHIQIIAFLSSSYADGLKVIRDGTHLGIYKCNKEEYAADGLMDTQSRVPTLYAHTSVSLCTTHIDWWSHGHTWNRVPHQPQLDPQLHPQLHLQLLHLQLHLQLHQPQRYSHYCSSSSQLQQSEHILCVFNAIMLHATCLNTSVPKLINTFFLLNATPSMCGRVPFHALDAGLRVGWWALLLVCSQTDQPLQTMALTQTASGS
jgi:hypothetical protein